jgi:large subunit ribosomal protein L13
MKTYSIKPKDVTRKWYLLDAKEVPLGRLATVAAGLLIGKGKPTVTAHIDGGDYVVIINSDALVVSGDKTKKKTYYRHSGYPGGLHKRTLDEQLQRDSTTVVTRAIRGMLPVNKLRPGRLARLKVYRDEQHQHQPQQPQHVSLKREGG